MTSLESNSHFSDFNFIKSFPLEESFLFLDEVGRGPLAGPVVSTCVYYHFQSDDFLIKDIEVLKKLKVTDSKKLTHAKRLKILKALNIDPSRVEFSNLISPTIFENRLLLSTCQSTHDEIDEINVLQASLLSMKRAAKSIIRHRKITHSVSLIDGNRAVDLPESKINTLIKGDLKSLFIALASITAKEVRDSLMKKYAQDYPEYGFEKHSGYPTSYHREKIEKFGPSKIHRKSFKLL